MKIGVIGVGGHGRGRHLAPYKRLEAQGLIEVAAVADINEERAKSAAKDFSVPHYYKDYAEMLQKEDLDGVSVVTPSGLHGEVGKQVLLSGVSALIDKPLAPSLSEATELVEIAKDKGATLMVGYWSRFSPALQYAISLGPSGYFGKVFFSYASILRRRGIPGIPTFIDDKLSGGKGAIFDIGCYLIDALLAVTGFPEPVSVSGRAFTVFGNKQDEINMNWGRWDPSTFKLDDYSVGFVKFADESTAFVESSWASNLPIQGEVSLLRVQGDNGGIEARGDEALRSITLSSKLNSKVLDSTPTLNKVDESYEMARAFVESIRTKNPPVTGEQSLKLHAIVDGIYESTKLGKEVEVHVPKV
ncbi:MAG: Gfo/Idh/MocA family protein [Thermoprotei archaeon]